MEIVGLIIGRFGTNVFDQYIDALLHNNILSRDDWQMLRILTESEQRDAITCYFKSLGIDFQFEEIDGRDTFNVKEIELPKTCRSIW